MWHCRIEPGPQNLNSDIGGDSRRFGIRAGGGRSEAGSQYCNPAELGICHATLRASAISKTASSCNTTITGFRRARPSRLPLSQARNAGWGISVRNNSTKAWRLWKMPGLPGCPRRASVISWRLSAFFFKATKSSPGLRQAAVVVEEQDPCPCRACRQG